MNVRKIGVCLLTLVMVILLNTKMSTVKAKMTILSPQEIIDRSDYIVIGNVVTNNTANKHHSIYAGMHKVVTISIETILKGELTQREVVLRRDVQTNDLGYPFEFPDVGTKVMVLLRNNTDGYSLTYANSVCVLDQSGEVQLYKGMGFGQFTPKDYENRYQVFYKNEVFKPKKRYNHG